MQPAELKVDIRKGLRRWQQRLLWQRCLIIAALIAVWLLLARLFAIESNILMFGTVALVIAGFGQLIFSQTWKRLNPENFVEHLNRCFADFEESARLLLADESGLTAMQYLQRQRVEKVYRKNLARVDRWQPRISYKLTTAIVISALLLSIFANDIRSFTQLSLTRVVPAGESRRETSIVNKSLSASIVITPPEYTGLAPVRTERLNLEVMEGSLVQWRLAFDGDGHSYALQLANDIRIPLKPAEQGIFEATARINKTGLYRIVPIAEIPETYPDDVYAITVNADQVPDIRVIMPQVSSLELPRDAPPQFTSEALVKDDFGIKRVEILASVAKGSGEAVKFRDQALDAGQSRETDKGILYQRDWNLVDLGMEPGDEVYFTVIATDNKQPQANTGRSTTMIVRWLDDEESVLTADGLAIDFIPEYFKSQRQIIIETEQLIEDEQALTVQVFREQSFSIGRSQAELKEKYGQYLGDEFEEGPVLDFSDSHAAEGSHDGEHADDSGANEFQSDNIELKSVADILQRFGHNHGDPEIGPIGRRNPVALMKRAVGEMWQAEKHLMQAEPEQALAFEYAAYKYLKLAREADRIYVKRLGFVPPPVSEDNRLSGELDDVMSYRTDTGNSPPDLASERGEQFLLYDIYQLLTNSSSYILLTSKDRSRLQDLSELLSRWAEQRPALIQHALTLEKVLLANRLQLQNCENCIGNLSSAIWGLINERRVDLRFRNAAWQPADEMSESYRQHIQKLPESLPGSASTPLPGPEPP